MIDKNIVNTTATEQVYQQQIALVAKIVPYSLWNGRSSFPKNLIHTISTYIFPNPLRLKKHVYHEASCTKIINNRQYLLVKKLFQNEQTQGSGFLTVIKRWKPIQLGQDNYFTVIMTGKMFLSFISNIKIQPFHPQQNQFDPFADQQNYKKQQKQKAKQHKLICDHPNIVSQYINEVLTYEKDKKITPIAIKAFIYLLQKAITIVKIQQNFNTGKLGLQGKYLYFQNQSCLPLQSGSSFYMTYKYGQWNFGEKFDQQVKVYQEVTYPLSRKKQYLISRQLQQYTKFDVWIQPGTQ